MLLWTLGCIGSFGLVSSIILNANRLNTPVRRHNSGWMDNKTRPLHMLSHKRLTSDWKIFHENINKQKEDRVAILMADKIDFKIKAITRDKEGPRNPTSGYLPEKNEH